MRIEFVPRAQWGASQTTEDFIAGRRSRRKDEKTEIHVHHTAAIDTHDSTPNRWTYDRAVAYMRRLQTVRPDLGPLPYSENVAVSEDAQTVWLFEGRGLLVSGAHTGGHNRPGIGWGCFGNFNHDDPEAVAAIVEALAYRITHLRRDGYVNLGTVLAPTGRIVWGHRDSKATSCPGDHLYTALSGITIRSQEEDTMRIRRGAHGNYVQPYQAALNRAGVVNNIVGYVPLVVDGEYGSATEQAVRLYQTAAGLDVTGELDDLTRDLLGRYMEPV